MIAILLFGVPGLINLNQEHATWDFDIGLDRRSETLETPFYAAPSSLFVA